MNYLGVLEQAVISLRDSENPLLEAQLLLAHCLGCSRGVVFAYPERELSSDQYRSYLQLIERRGQGEPLAYVLGEREFWSLNLRVTPDTLIPRPETELLVERVLATLPTETQDVADLGTGSGAIVLALARERPNWHFFACDRSAKALRVAEENARRLAIHNISFHQGDWCLALPQQRFHAIVSNPPYLALNDPHLHQGDLRFEPQAALVSEENGFAALKTIARQACDYLNTNGWLVLEHGYEQKQELVNYLGRLGYKQITDYPDLAGLDRVVCAQYR